MRTVDTRPIMEAIEKIGNLKEGHVDFQPVIEAIDVVAEDRAIQDDDNLTIIDLLESIEAGIVQLHEKKEKGMEKEVDQLTAAILATKAAVQIQSKSITLFIRDTKQYQEDTKAERKEVLERLRKPWYKFWK
ncbi:MAG: hypothetical protein CMI54_00355 [Parcubacteria group bacterium]|nr:hypothetical protein [Parcubacteria group bacterium]|tara:strand:- start:3008 stop:3403 length:396 start_codon:yes stop_codon:yes gene_type:complete